jgi:hypothetical protein
MGKNGIVSIISGVLVIGVGFAMGGSIFMGDFTPFNIFFDGLGIFFIGKGIYQMTQG